MRFKHIFFVSLFLLLAGCRFEKAANLIPEVAESSIDDAVIVKEEDVIESDAVNIGEDAIIDEVVLMYPSTWPEEIELVIDGYFPDGCTKLLEVVKTQNSHDFGVKIRTQKPGEMDCTMALVPFSINVNFDLHGLPEGVHQIDVYGHVVNFELDVFFEPEELGG